MLVKYIKEQNQEHFYNSGFWIAPLIGLRNRHLYPLLTYNGGNDAGEQPAGAANPTSLFLISYGVSPVIHWRYTG